MTREFELDLTLPKEEFETALAAMIADIEAFLAEDAEEEGE